MKYIFLIILGSWFSSVNLLAQDKIDSVKPKKKHIKTVEYKLKKGELKNRDSLFASNSYPYSFMVFDKNGHMIEVGRKNADGSLINKNVYIKDEKGISAKGFKIIASNEIERYWINQYDLDGNLIKTKTYDSGDNLIHHSTLKYDAQGNVIEKSVTDVLLNSGYRIINEYNVNGKLKQRFKYSLEGELLTVSKYAYKKRKFFHTMKDKKDGSQFKQVYKYDAGKNLIGLNTYDNEGDLIGKRSYDYIYDDFGNWITQKCRSYGKLHTVMEREIEYYK